MSTDFYLVRHAQKETGIGDVFVSSEGLEQASITAEHFCKVPFSRIVCSPLNRAKHTAQIISETTKKVLTEDIRLRERANWGDLPEQTFQEFVDMWNQCTKERDLSPPNGNSARRAGERFASCLLELADQHLQECLVIVTHGGVITDFLVNEFTREELNSRHPNFIDEQSNLVAECSITKIRCHRGKFVLLDFANITHLNH
ncbi:histidine phosphatase family protein [Paenibacillus sp. 22594]|uniref:histidine phosphatase family protein n=1 Tax=Paenibacillus sp. 22594 TaxID=3453947 RepID=UPI003F83E31A